MNSQVLLNEALTVNQSAFLLNFAGHLSGNLNIAVLIYICYFKFLKDQNLKALAKAVMISLPIPTALTYVCWFVFG